MKAKLTAEFRMKEAAEATGYSRKTLYFLISSGRVRARKAPGDWQYWIDRDSLLNYLQGGKPVRGPKPNRRMKVAS